MHLSQLPFIQGSEAEDDPKALPPKHKEEKGISPKKKSMKSRGDGSGALQWFGLKVSIWCVAGSTTYAASQNGLPAHTICTSLFANTSTGGPEDMRWDQSPRHIFQCSQAVLGWGIMCAAFVPGGNLNKSRIVLGPLRWLTLHKRNHPSFPHCHNHLLSASCEQRNSLYFCTVCPKFRLIAS